MDIFWRLAFGHLLGDFTLQTNCIAAWKRRSLAGLFVHATLHPVLYVILARPYLNQVWVRVSSLPLNGWVCIFLIYVTHFLEDEWRVWSVNRGAPDNFLFYVWDQVIHLVILFAFSPMSDRLVSSKWPILGCLFVLVTHFSTVTVYYIEKDIYGSNYPLTEEKYMSMVYRLAAALCFLLPGSWWVFIMTMIIGRFTWHIYQKHFDFSWTSTLLGNILVIVCGTLARFVLYRT